MKQPPIRIDRLSASNGWSHNDNNGPITGEPQRQGVLGLILLYGFAIYGVFRLATDLIMALLR